MIYKCIYLMIIDEKLSITKSVRQTDENLVGTLDETECIPRNIVCSSPRYLSIDRRFAAMVYAYIK